MEREYYEISEALARTATHMNYMDEYMEGSATAIYRAKADAVYDVAEEIREEKPELSERAERMAGRYSKRLADYYNAYYRNEASCPSILISGAGNFPVRKKEKQNQRRDALMQQYMELEEYAKKIRHLLTMEQPILSKDENVIERLEDKLQSLEERQDAMKKANAYYRRMKTLDGCPHIIPEEIERIKDMMERGVHFTDVPYESFTLRNNSASIRNTRARLEQIKAAKEKGNTETDLGFCRAVENADIMRLQLFFEEKPSAEVRGVLKKHGFKWAPSHKAWQRNLTGNAKFDLKYAIKEIRELGGDAA